jgi:LmbE family N-acetylglucosaminyl deacetylase
MRGIVAVVAHPDDESLIAGGTLALAARAGLRAGVLSLTRGELGPIACPELSDREHLGEVRAAELQEAARALGLSWADCLPLPDGELPWADLDLVGGMVAERLAREHAQVVLTFGEDGLYGHPDHAAAAQIAHRAAQRLRGSVVIYEAAWQPDTMPALAAAARERGLPDDLWGIEPRAFGTARRADVMLDIRAVLPQKLAALRSHRTQLSPTHLLAALPLDLAEQYLGSEPWAGPGDHHLQELLGLG